MNTSFEKILNIILDWKKFWFGLIFLGSVLNALAKQSAYLGSIENISLWAFLLGGLIGLIAKFRGAWL
ncbi:hypothetical protein N9829_00780 [Gammaproteobacteria bacterium]|nr:hypothetical protein [Gammaproteobacteria bacterium]MDB4230332.1 hypothetical protein [Gammaproteobacteria bacterium]MDB9854668.1 hypothetical protein [Gammaproteobacteria bacterium]MDC0437215.1 hypothetical protein [Gammaproteobacteria bacterium]MDC1161299.1 hypothetical protein [Gammaproteobacteria bacterium]